MTPTEFQAARLELGLSQQGLAAALGVSQGNVSRWEQGALPVPLSVDLLLRAARRFAGVRAMLGLKELQQKFPAGRRGRPPTAEGSPPAPQAGPDLQRTRPSD
jgi:transcriptional regulator with XRE-family HTH domain